MDAASPNLTERIRRGLEQTRERIRAAARAAGRDPEEIALIAVTKYAPLAAVEALVALGHLDLGESRAQQLEERHAWFAARPQPAPVRWHMIGHLQRNKVRQVAPYASLIHSVDSLRLAEELSAWGAKSQARLDILLQVNASGEASKTGLPPAAVLHLAEQVETLPFLRIRGLMTMAAPTGEPMREARPTFARLREIHQEGVRLGLGHGQFNILSMGMSNDLEAAVLEGANVLRVGSGIFGADGTPPAPGAAQ